MYNVNLFEDLQVNTFMHKYTLPIYYDRFEIGLAYILTDFRTLELKMGFSDIKTFSCKLSRCILNNMNNY